MKLFNFIKIIIPVSVSLKEFLIKCLIKFVFPDCFLPNINTLDAHLEQCGF